jgi:hypothetical protein
LNKINDVDRKAQPSSSARRQRADFAEPSSAERKSKNLIIRRRLKTMAGQAKSRNYENTKLN